MLSKCNDPKKIIGAACFWVIAGGLELTSAILLSKYVSESAGKAVVAIMSGTLATTTVSLCAFGIFKRVKEHHQDKEDPELGAILIESTSIIH